MIRSLVRSKMAFCLVTKSTALSDAARIRCPVVIVGRFGSYPRSAKNGDVDGFWVLAMSHLSVQRKRLWR